MAQKISIKKSHSTIQISSNIQMSQSISLAAPSMLSNIESLDNDSDNEMDYHTEMVQFFYKEILKQVLEKHAKLPPHNFRDSDEEPTYETEKKSIPVNDSEIWHKSYKQMPTIESGSKLRDRIIQSQSRAHHVSSINKSIIEHFSLPYSKTSTRIRIFSGPRREYMTTASNLSNDMDYEDLTSEHNSVNDEDDEELNISDFFDYNGKQLLRLTLKFSTGTIYHGDVVKHKFHGKGVYIWPNGTFYEGEFQNGTITGFGKLTYCDLSYYQGQFDNCILEGEGTFNPSSSPVSYSGNWSRGKPHGKGYLRYSEDDWYHGDWYEGMRQGQGQRNYANRDLYVGSWHMGVPNGHGEMVFANRDYYTGEWFNGKPHGDGVYTWDCNLSRGMTVSVQNQYTGHFINGQRDGYGIQIFGMDGSKCASQFDDGKKSGGGILICGDGTTIEKKQLFAMDNPVACMNLNPNQRLSLIPVAAHKSKVSFLGTKIKSILANISDVGDEKKSKIDDTFPQIENFGTPLSLPLHATCKDMDLSWHISRLLGLFKVQRKLEPKRVKVHNAIVRYSKDIKNPLIKNIPLRLLKIKSRLTIGDENRSIVVFAVDNEKRLLSRSINNNYLFIRQVYQKYATLNPLQHCCVEFRNPCLNRLRLWQFLRDINLNQYGLSLIDLDLILLDIPNIHLEFEHDPFEPIYFWQFMHCLLVLAFVVFEFKFKDLQQKNQTGVGLDNLDLEDNLDKNATYQEIFSNFLSQVVVPLCEFKGRALFECKDLLPIHPLHDLYVSIGEPHTVRVLFNKISPKLNEILLDCLVRPRKVKPLKKCYKHYVLGGNEVVFLNAGLNDAWVMEKDEEPKVKFVEDSFFTDLRVFRVLGPVRVMKCITDVCGNVREDNMIVFVDYKITFLEFYEILINLAEELNRDRKAKEAELKKGNEEDVEEVKVTPKGKKGKGKGKK